MPIPRTSSPEPGAERERAIIYIRKSQRDGGDDEHSPEVQARAGIRHCEDESYLLDARDILDENVGTDGKVRNASAGAGLDARPKLARAVALIEAKTHHVLVAERGDRIFRDLDVQREVIRRIEAAGGRIEPVKGVALSHATAESELHSTIDGAVAQYQRRTAKDRAWDAVEEAIAQGKMPGRISPGLIRGEGGKLAWGDPGVIAIMREAFDRRYHGATTREVQTYLAEHGIRRTVTGVRKLLASKQYLGEIHFGNHTPNLSACDPIIDRDVYDRVNAMVVPGGRRGKSDRLLARLGILRCGTCNGRMSASMARGGGGTYYPMYRCTSQSCARPVTIMALAVESAVTEAVILAERDRTGRAAMIGQAKDAADAADAAQARLDSVIELLSGMEDQAATQRKLAAMRAEVGTLRARAAQLAAAAGPGVSTADAEWTFTHGPLPERRSLVRNRVELVSIEPGRGDERITIHLFGQAPARHAVKNTL